MRQGSQNEIMAAVLALSYFHTALDPLAYWGKLGLPTADMKCLTKDLGMKWDLFENTIKLGRCGIDCIHPFTDECLSIQHGGFQSAAMDRLDLVVNPQCMRLCFIRHPASPLECVFSLNHGCAAALLQGKATPREVSARYPMILNSL